MLKYLNLKNEIPHDKLGLDKTLHKKSNGDLLGDLICQHSNIIKK